MSLSMTSMSFVNLLSILPRGILSKNSFRGAKRRLETIFLCILLADINEAKQRIEALMITQNIQPIDKQAQTFMQNVCQSGSGCSAQTLIQILEITFIPCCVPNARTKGMKKYHPPLFLKYSLQIDSSTCPFFLSSTRIRFSYFPPFADFNSLDSYSFTCMSSSFSSSFLNSQWLVEMKFAFQFLLSQESSSAVKSSF